MEIKEMLLTPNPFSRPQTPLRKVSHIVIHWVANPGSTAVANRNYFENLKGGERYASAHYIVGLQGEVIRCIPENEIAYHAKQANDYSIGIENCHPDAVGRFNAKTYVSLIQLCAQLCEKYHLEPEHALLRHYDITGKICPKYYIENPKEWLKLKKDVKQAMLHEKQDKELEKALKDLKKLGILLDFNSWKQTEKMNMKYAKLMVEKIGRGFGMQSYAQTINFLVERGCIGTRALWDNQNFKPEWCRALLIKVSKRLSASNESDVHK